MPLRDHFHPPLSGLHSWQELHGGWPMVIVMGLNRRLPPGYRAAPQIRLGRSIEVDVAAFDRGRSVVGQAGGLGEHGGVAVADWAPPEPTATLDVDWGELDEYEVRVYDAERGQRLVAAIEIVSPANKDRPDHRRAFVAKCSALLQNQICVVVVDLIPSASVDLHAELLDSFGQDDPAQVDRLPDTQATSYRSSDEGGAVKVEMWSHPLMVGQPLPTLPLWLAPNLAVPLDLETSYEETCRALLIS